MLYGFISHHRAEILARCLKELKDQCPNRPDHELLEGMSSFVDGLVAAMARDAGVPEHETEDSADRDSLARQHGTIRRTQGFELTRIVHDYGLVCEAITELASEHRVTFNAREYQLLNRGVDDAIAMAVASFEETRSAEERGRAEHLGFVVHEIRNAVGNASVGFELIRRGKAGTEGRTADVVHRALARIANLVAESLAEARLIGGITQREWMPLGDFFTQLVAEYSAERGIRIQIEVPDDLHIDVDERLLASAVSNLLQNALKFTHDNETIILRAFTTDGAVAIEVEDRCGGLAIGDTEDLFPAFVQGIADRRGTGLGLAIARRAVEAHGGTLTARNLPGRGCVFAILMPQTTRILREHQDKPTT